MNYRGESFALLLILFQLFNFSIIAQNPGIKFYNSGLIHYEYARYDSALHCLHQAEKDFANCRDDKNWVKARFALADIYHEMAQYDCSNNIIENIELLLNKQTTDINIEFLVNSYYVNHYCVFADIPKASEYLDKMNKLIVLLKDSALCQKYLYNNYQLKYLKGDYKNAMLYIDSAIDLTKSKVQLAKYFVIKQLIAYRLTNYGEQTRYLQLCGELINELDLKNHWINAKFNEGYGYRNMDAAKFDLCLENNKKSYNILKKLYPEYHPEIANVNNQLGISFNKDDDSAIYCHRQALKIRKKIFGEDNFMCSYSYNNLGNMMKKKNNFDSAAWYYEKAIKIREKELGLHHPKMANSYLKIADLYVSLGDYRKKLKYCQLALCSSIPEYNDTANCFENPVIGSKICSRETLLSFKSKANALNGIGLSESNDSISIMMFKKAVECAKKVDTININCFLNGFSYDDLLFQANYNNGFMASAMLFVLFEKTNQIEYLSEAIKINDSGKSSTLFHNLKLNAKLQEEDIALYQKIKKEKFGLVKKIITGDKDVDSKSEKDSLQHLLKKLDNDLLQVDIKLRRNRPECYYWLKGQNEFDIKKIQDKLPENTGIYYLISAGGGKTRVIISKDTLCYKYEYLPELNEVTIRSFRSMVEKNMDLDSSFFKMGYQLYKAYFPKEIDSVLESRKIQNLIIISDDEVWTLPFEALLTQDFTSKPGSVRDLPFLLKKCNISYSPSLYFAYHSFCQKEVKKFKNDILLVAPVFNEPQLAYASSSTRAYFENLEKDKSSEAPIDNSVLRDNKIGALPYTEFEVKGIDDEFREKHQKTKLLINKNASYSKVLQNLDEPYRIVHFATHGIVNMGFPDLSGIILANDGSENEDILFAGDLPTTKLSADLVVLSACETAYGKVVSGDGIYSLSQSFAAQGVPNVMASLWKVADKSTARFMLDFYKDLLKTRFASYSGSLRKAKLKMLESDNYCHPFYWSPFVLSKY